MFVCLFACLFVCLLACLFVCLFVSLFVFLFVSVGAEWRACLGELGGRRLPNPNDEEGLDRFLGNVLGPLTTATGVLQKARALPAANKKRAKPGDGMFGVGIDALCCVSFRYKSLLADSVC